MGPSDTPADAPGPLPGELPSDGFSISSFEHTPVPDATPENFICMRGPCRHYWHSVGDFDAGNPAGTFEAMGLPQPREHFHVCLLDDSQLKDRVIMECSRWDPQTKRELKKIEKRRKAYFKRDKKIALHVMKEKHVD